MNSNKLRIALMFGFFLQFYFASVNTVNAQSLFFRKYAIPQEFGNERINLIFQDNHNFIWLGTTRGLLRFDGNSFLHFERESDKPGEVTALFDDKTGVLWIGYESGKIDNFKNEKFVAYSPEEGFPKVRITAFGEDASGALWYATYGEGIYIIKNNRTYNINVGDGLPDNFVYDLKSDGEGNMWFGTDGGLVRCRFEEGNKLIKTFDTSRGLPDNIVTAVNVDTEGKVWIGMESKGIARLDPENDSLKIILPDWEFGSVNAIQLFKRRVWIGTSQGKVLQVGSNGNGIEEKSGPGEDFSRISDMENDTTGNVWLTAGTSEFFYTNPTFTFLSQKNETQIDNIQAILYTRSNTVFYSNGKNVFNYSILTDSLAKVKFRDGAFSGQNVISLYEDVYGHIWLGTFDNGVYVFHPESGAILNITENDGLVNNNVLSISGVGNEVWLATLGGVSKCSIKNNIADKGFISKIYNYTTESGLGSNFIYHVFVDSHERVWFATDGRGVTVLENNEFKNFSKTEGLSSEVIYSVTEDLEGNIWVSSANNGILRYRDGNFEQYQPKTNIRDYSISSIIGDRNGNFLLLSKQGIDILNPETGIINYHGEESGIAGIDPNLNAYSIDSIGNIWLGTQSGIIKYNSRISQKQQKSITRINKVLVYLNELEIKNGQRLGPDQNHISFDYIGFWYSNPQEVTYQVKLEGYDREWINSKNKFITYPNLPPGGYNFMVRSSITSNFDEADIQEYSFVIQPPFYKTVWFYAISFISTIFLIFLFIKRREKKLKASERIKKEQIEFQFNTLKSQVNPHFLFNSFNTLIAVIEEDQPTAVEYVEKLSDFYRNILQHREKDVILLKEELQMIGDYYFLQLKRYKDNFVLKVEVPESYFENKIPPLTIQLLVENAIKHNIIVKEKPLMVEIFVENDLLTVKNNRQLKQQYEPSTGVGLKNIIERFKLLSDKEVLVEECTGFFMVKLPLLK